MTIYLDENYRCRVSAAEGLRPFALPFFDGKCRRFVEGYRYVPAGECWLRPDGTAFWGEMLAPAEDYAVLAAAQQQYEELLPELQDKTAALALLGVE